MYNPAQKQIILKNSFGISYHVYYESGRGLCVRMLDKSGVWSRSYILSDQSVNDFSVVLDRDDIFHFVYQSVDGRILYGHGRHGQIDMQPILTGKDKTPWMKYVSLMFYRNKLMFFYIIKYQSRCLLSMQTLEKGILSKPVAIDYLDASGKSYYAFVDRQGKCHLIYTNNDNSVKRLMHRVYKDDLNIFSAPVKVYGSEHNIQLSGVVCSEKLIHLLFQVSQVNSWQVIYMELTSDKAPKCLYESSSPPGFTGLIYHNKIIRFFRVVGNNIYVRSSTNLGSVWSGEVLYPFGSTGSDISLTCFTYFTNFSKELPDLSCQELPGNFSRGYQLAFLNEQGRPFQSETNGIEYPYNGSRDLIDSDGDDKTSRKLNKKIMQLQNITSNMQKELTRLWLTQKEYEKKINQLMRSIDILKDSLPGHEEAGGADRVPDYEDKTPRQEDETLTLGDD